MTYQERHNLLSWGITKPKFPFSEIKSSKYQFAEVAYDLDRAAKRYCEITIDLAEAAYDLDCAFQRYCEIITDRFHGPKQGELFSHSIQQWETIAAQMKVINDEFLAELAEESLVSRV